MPIKLFVSRRPTDPIFCQIEKNSMWIKKQAKYSIKYKYEVCSSVLNLHNFVSLRATGNETFYWYGLVGKILRTSLNPFQMESLSKYDADQLHK